MDEINRRMLEARRNQALQDRVRLEAEAETRAAQPPPDAGELGNPAGAGRLMLERRQGEWRYYLCEHRIRVGDALEFYVDPQIGWVRGSFQWGRKNTSPPTIRITIVHPEDPAVFVGEAVINLPDDAICRWPEP